MAPKRRLRSNSEEPQALQLQDPEQIMRQNKRKNKQSSRASSRASTQEPEDAIAPSSTSEDAIVHPTTEIEMETAPEPESDIEPEQLEQPEPQSIAEPIVPASASQVETAPIDQFYPHHNLSLIMEEPTEESILATQYTRTQYTRGTFAETVVELSSESDEESVDDQQHFEQSALEREYETFSSPFEPTFASTPLPIVQQLRQIQAQLESKEAAIQQLQEQNTQLQERNAALEATIVFLTTQNPPLSPPTDASTSPETKSLFSRIASPFKGFWGSSTKAPSSTPDIKVTTSMETTKIPSLKPNSSNRQHKSPRTPVRPIQRAKSHTSKPSKTVTFNALPPRANSEDPEQAAAAPTPATITREPWQIYSYRRRRGLFLAEYEAWKAQEEARLRSGLPETKPEQEQRRIMENKKALVDQAIAHSKKQQAINKTASATPLNKSTKRPAAVVSHEGSPMKRQRLQQPNTPSPAPPIPESPTPPPQEPELPLSPGRTFQVPSEDDEDASEEVSIGRTFAVPEYSSSESEDESMEEAEAVEVTEAPVTTEATQKKRKRIEDEEQELARREEENNRRALRIEETEKELNRRHAEQVEKQKAAAAATPPVPTWTQPPPPTPSPQHAQLPKPAPVSAPTPAPIPAPQNKYAPKKPSRLRESTTYSPVRQSIEEDVITIPPPKQHGFLIGARYPTPPDEELDQGLQALLSVVKFVSPLSGR